MPFTTPIARALAASFVVLLLLWQSAMFPLVASTIALHQVSSSASDDLGRGWKTLDAKQHLTTSLYDNLGRATTTLLHDGTQMRSAYDSIGRMRASWTLDKDGATQFGWKKLSYNDRGEMDAVIQSTNGIPTDNGSGANDLVTRFTYDELGRKITQTDAKNQTTRMGYDIRGRMSWRQLPDGKTETMVYDALGQLREKTDFRGYTTTYDYDVRGRMKSKTPDARLTGEEAVLYSYNGENYREAKRGALVTSYTSDADRGWLTMVIGPKGTVTYDYSDFGDRIEVKAPGGTTTYTYDALGRMDTVSDKATGESTAKELAKYRYDAVGNLDTTVTSNGASVPVATSRYGYDALNRLDVMTHRRGLQADGALLSSYDYDVRADGKRKGYDEIVANDQTAATPRVSSRTVAFAYDDAGRLIKEESRDGEGTAYELNWALDKVGNRILETRLKAKDATSTDWMGGSLTRIQSSYSSTGTDWLTLTSSTRGTPNAAATSFVGATTETQSGYGYDSNGSQTRKTTQAGESNSSEGMEWSFEGALLRVEKGENNATKFTYDAGGNRVQALTRDGAKMSAANYLVDENTAYAQVLEERDSGGVLQARYVYGQGYGPILLQRAQKNAAGVEEIRTRYLLADGHGSVRQLVTASGTVTDSYFYDAWGGGLSGGSGNTVNPYRYNGQQTDEATGGYYLRARYYQPGQGRFLGHDPVLGNNSDPETLHRYLYAGGDGVNFVDPSGKVTAAETLTALAVTGIFTAMYMTHSSTYGQHVALIPNLNEVTTLIQTVEIQNSSMLPVNRAFDALRDFESYYPFAVEGMSSGGAALNDNLTFLVLHGVQALPVHVYLFDSSAPIFAVETTGGHILAGYRYWRAFRSPTTNNIVLETAAIEQPAPEPSGSNILKMKFGYNDGIGSYFQGDSWRRYTNSIIDGLGYSKVVGGAYDNQLGTRSSGASASVVNKLQLQLSAMGGSIA